MKRLRHERKENFLKVIKSVCYSLKPSQSGLGEQNCYLIPTEFIVKWFVGGMGKTMKLTYNLDVTIAVNSRKELRSCVLTKLEVE